MILWRSFQVRLLHKAAGSSIIAENVRSLGIDPWVVCLGSHALFLCATPCFCSSDSKGEIIVSEGALVNLGQRTQSHFFNFESVARVKVLLGPRSPISAQHAPS